MTEVRGVLHAQCRVVLTHTRTKTGEETPESSLLAQRDQSVDHRPLRAVTLVDLGQQGVGGLKSVSIA